MKHAHTSVMESISHIGDTIDSEQKEKDQLKHGFLQCVENKPHDHKNSNLNKIRVFSEIVGSYKVGDWEKAEKQHLI